MGSIYEHNRLARLTRRIFYLLNFVQNREFKSLLLQDFNVVSHNGVSREDNRMFHSLVDIAFRAVISVDIEIRGKFFKFRRPVVNQTFGNDYDARFFDSVFVGKRKDGNRLNRFSQAHIVSKASTEIVISEIRKPLDSVPLIIS